MERPARLDMGNGSYRHKKTADTDKSKERRHSNNKENKNGNMTAVNGDVQTCPRKAMVDLIGTGYPHKDMLSAGCSNDRDADNNELRGIIMSLLLSSIPAGCPQRPPAPWDLGRRRQQQRRPVMVHGRPLLELLSLSANFLIKGTITVFDRKHAQIIYENYDRGQGHAHLPTCSNNPEAGFTRLILTGPHTAISADGESFAIKLDPSGPKNDESEDAREFWECSISEANNGIVESVISTEKGKIIVTYAVLNNAVEATMQVNLVGFAAYTHVYGRITARIQDFDEEDNILLLSRPPQDPLQLIHSSASAFIIPLSRAIIAVPVDSYIDVVVDIYATSIHQDTAPIHFQDNLCLPFGEHTLRIHTAMGDLTVSVNITN